ncbi:hypothetical protein [Leptothoe sp. PORK10 BA2]|uniref:hypothetical protein n=1 Tax=Leptothoe sp. PORK10 BA2 TaxID=3110254 RepID=UPI002B200623|nr:hypothetical protein [Leptothoe sp. PORK10 BA2]MEA5465544.1 hypothetical protein [Leptothoe sp. PORK10 BA2]
MVFVSTKPTLPSWLCENILQGTLPWQKSSIQPYSHFNHVYTLHDSFLLGTYQSAETYGESVLCFLWDALWLPESVTHQAQPGEPIFLLIKATKTMGIVFSEGTLPKSEKQPRRILKAEHVEVDDQTVLVIDDIHRNTLTVVFSGQLHFLAMDNRQRQLTLDIKVDS